MNKATVNAQIKKLIDLLSLPYKVATYQPSHFEDDMTGYDCLFLSVGDMVLNNSNLYGDNETFSCGDTLYYHTGDVTIGSLFESIENPTLIYETYDAVEWAPYLWLFTVHMWKYKDKHVTFKQCNVDNDYGDYEEYEIKVGEYDELMKDIHDEYILFNNKKIEIKNSDEKSKEN